ncbi:TPA: GNAT family N-acetyltransferase [Legionella pneumophila]
MNTHSEISIRSAQEKDARAIAEIHVASWQKIYRSHIPDTVLDNLSISEREQQWRALINNKVKIWLIEENNEIVGFVSICPSRDTDTNPNTCGEISAIYLNPNVWHQGLGKKLCRRALTELENMGFSEVILWVLQENELARKFYERMGFIETNNLKADQYDKDVILNEVRYFKKLKNNFSFKPLQENDLKLLCKWLDKPHVKEWWDDGLNQEEIKEKYRQRIGDKTVVPFIVYLEDNPIGFIKYYHANKVGDGWWPDEIEGTVGIDQFIGEEKYINRGYGTQMIQKFIKKLFQSSNIKKIITDVDPDNLRAINCYKKAGFKFVKELITPDGIAFLMEIKRV